MSDAPAGATRVERMFDGLLRSENENAKITLTVAVCDAAGGHRLHETFTIKRWKGRMLFVSVANSGDWDAGIKPITACSLNLTTGEVEDGGKRDPERVSSLLGWAGQCALHYARTGKPFAPPNGTVTVQETDDCGACGRKLKDPDSLRLGIGPDCEKRLYGTRRKGKSRKMRSTS